MKRIVSIIALGLAASAFTVLAQDTSTPAKSKRQGPRTPLVAALDANNDGVIDAAEIANAPAALKALDKNNDDQLTRDEYTLQRKGKKGKKHGKKQAAPAAAAAPVAPAAPTAPAN